MVIPGYDPEDLDDMLQSHMDAREIQTFLTDEERAAYRNGDETLVALLDDDEIHELVRKKNVPVDVPDEGE